MIELNKYFIIFLVVIFVIYFIKFKNNKNNKKIDNITEEDIKNIVKEGTEKGTIETEEQELIHSIFEFSDTTVSEILTPRTMVYALDMEKTLKEVWDDIVEQGFSRIPVYDKTIDKIVGILYIKDLLKYNKDKNGYLKIKELIKKPFFVPITKTLLEILEDFKRKKTHIAIIVDEYGGTEGIVTIEDVIEELVGEIQDEFDQEDEVVQKINEKIYDIRSDMLVEEVNTEFNINIPLSEEYDTISGYIQDELGKVAEVGDQVHNKNFILKVMEVDNKRIEKVRIIIDENRESENVYKD